ncbi:unnamed protein product [Rhizophagus irregularis]|nr:unnamed protein product [Rhizophagus irregularis]
MTLFDNGTFSHKHWRVGTFSSYRFCNDSRTRLITGNASQDCKDSSGYRWSNLCNACAAIFVSSLQEGTN